MTWILKSFSELTLDELYDIIALRNEVFICEQQCIYQDIDGLDKKTWHLFAKSENSQQIIAYTRLLPQDVTFSQASIGRVIVAKDYRGSGLAHELMTKAISMTLELFNTNTIKIMAQEYLVSFYQSHGFVITSESYLEDNIPHIDMLLTQYNEG